MIVQIYRLFPAIHSELLDELSPHPRPPEVRGEPVPAAMRAEVILHPIRPRIVQPNALSLNSETG